MKLRSDLMAEKRYLNNLMKSTKDEKEQMDIFRRLSKITSDIKFWERRGL